MSGNDSLAKSGIISYYNQNLRQQQRLYNGAVYTGYASKIKGNAYFIRDWQKGSVVYEGIQYYDVPVLYDTYKDQVIIQHYNDLYIISLVSAKVQSFTLPGHLFVRVGSDTPVANMQEGFYEVLADGEITVLAKRIKRLREYINVTMEYEFTEHEQFFIRKNGIYTEIRGEGKLLDAFGDYRNQVKQYLRKNHIRYKNTPEQAIVKAVEYYESVKK